MSQDAAFFSLVHLLGRICDWRDYARNTEAMRARIAAGHTGGLGPIFALAYPLTDEEERPAPPPRLAGPPLAAR